MSFLAACFRSQRNDPEPSEARADRSKCIFCNVDSTRFNIVLEDDKFICFKDRSPAAAHHLLVIPRTHIANVKSLRSDDVSLVEAMHTFGRRALDMVSPDTSERAEQRRYGFHIPPFRSVDHLHLHALALPFVSSLKALKYRVSPGGAAHGTHKGYSWFAEWAQTCAILRDGGRVKVGPC